MGLAGAGPGEPANLVLLKLQQGEGVPTDKLDSHCRTHLRLGRSSLSAQDRGIGDQETTEAPAVVGHGFSDWAERGVRGRSVRAASTESSTEPYQLPIYERERAHLEDASASTCMNQGQVGGPNKLSCHSAAVRTSIGW